MTNRLDDKISAFVLELVDDPPAAPEIDFQAAKDPVPNQLHRTPPQRRTSVPVVAIFGAAFLVLIAIGIPVLLFSGGDSEGVNQPTTTVIATTTVPPTTTPPTTAVQPATTTTEAPPVAGPLLEWERIESAALDPGLIWAVASSDETIVAVGEVTYDVDPPAEDGPFGAIWVSTDAVEWARIDDPGILGGDEGAEIIWDVVAGPSGFIASGQDGRNSVLWFSADGYIWQRVLDDDLGTPGEIEDLTVGSGGPGWIAAAIEWGPISSPTGVYLTSVNGIDWATVSDPDEAGTLDAELRPLGHEWRSPYAFPASASGRMPITHAPTGGDGPWDYAWNGDQVMAVARNNIPDIWVSPDAGLTWYQVGHDQPALDGPYPATQTLGVEFFDGKYVVVGLAGDSAGVDSAGVWHGTWPEP